MTKTGIKVSGDAQQKMLGWLPQLGEWYRVAEGSRLYGYTKLDELKAHYGIGTLVKDKPKTDGKMEVKSTAEIWMAENELFFVTRISTPDYNDEPAIIDFMSQVEKKICHFVIFPPKTSIGLKFWEAILLHVDYAKEDAKVSAPSKTRKSTKRA